MTVTRDTTDERVRCVLALGSNLGDREETIAKAVADLDSVSGMTVERVSPFYETPAIKPHGVDPDAPRYLNGVVIVHTQLTPHALLDAINAIERAHGRVRGQSVWDDRSLDIDIITYGDRELLDASLMIPHPRAWQRAFVLQPWLDIEPEAVIPGYGSVAAFREAALDEVQSYVAERER